MPERMRLMLLLTFAVVELQWWREARRRELIWQHQELLRREAALRANLEESRAFAQRIADAELEKEHQALLRMERWGQ